MREGEESMHTFGGDNTAIGRAHGEELREEIRAISAWYQSEWWELTTSALHDAVAPMRAATRRVAPHLADEIEAIGEASGVGSDLAWGLNARTELRPRAEALECTSVGLRSATGSLEDVLLAQNWDWWNTLRRHTRVIRLEPTGVMPIVTLVEPGMVAKIGMNAHGVGVGLNFLSTPRVDPDAVPVHVLCRLALERDSFEAALTTIEETPRAACANIMLGDADDHVANVECGPGWIHVERAEFFVTHTNSNRYFGERCARNMVFDAELTHNFSSISHLVVEHALRLEGVEAPALSIPGVETVHRVRMWLRQRLFEVSGGARDPEYRCYGV